MNQLTPLLKSKTYAGQAGYYLLNGRWHKVNTGHSAPKGAPKAAHPHAAGQHAPVGHFTDAEWGQLKLPPENQNASYFNKQVDNMKAMADAGHVTGILGLQYGTNTYGKKLAHIANAVLEKYGVDHKVTPGQKAGEHAAVQESPAQAQGIPEAEKNPEPATKTITQKLKEAVAAAAETPQNTKAKPVADKPFGALIKEQLGLDVEIKGGGDSHKGITIFTHNLHQHQIHAIENFGKNYNKFSVTPAGHKALTLKPIKPEVGKKSGASAKPEPSTVAKPEEKGWAPSKSDYLSLMGKPEADIKATLTEWGDKMGGTDKLIAHLQAIASSEAKSASKAKSSSEASPKADKKQDYAVGDTVDSTKLHSLKPGSVVEIFNNGKPWRKALIGGNKIWFEKKSGGAGWQKNPLSNQHHIGMLKGQYGEIKLQSVGAEGWLPDGQKTVANQLFDAKKEKNPELSAYKLKHAVVLGEIGKPSSFVWIDESGEWGAGFKDLDLIKLKNGDGLEPISLGGKPEAKAEIGPKEGDTKEGADGILVLKDGHWVKQGVEAPAKKLGKVGEALKAALSGKPVKAEADTKAVSMPEFTNGKASKGAAAYYEGVGKEVLAAAQAKDLDALIAMKENGLKPMSSGKISATWSGKTENSKKLLQMHADAVASLGGDASAATAQEPVQPQAESAPVAAQASKAESSAEAVTGSVKANLDAIPWDNLLLPAENKNAKSHNKKVAELKAMAYAGDVNGLNAFKAGTNTYGKKQNLLAATAAAAFASEEPAVAPAAEPAPTPAPSPDPAPAPAPVQAQAEESPKITPEAKALLDEIKWNTLITAGGGHLGKANNQKVMDIKAMAYKGDTDGINAFIENAAGGYGTGLAKAALIALGKPYIGPEKPDDGPKDGDTKQGADGMLVFKDGHWHKQEEAPPAKKLKASEAISIGKVYKTAPGMKAKLKAMAVAGNVGELQEFIDSDSDLFASKNYAKALISAMTTHTTPEPEVAAPGSTIESMDGWEQTGGQGGSNPGGKFKDSNGVEWYCKFPSDDAVAKSEVLAAKLYAAAGVAGQDAKLIMKDGKLGIASKWTQVEKATSPAVLSKFDGVAQGFAVDAWLGNWDVVGLAYDNLQIDSNGKAVRIDAGGSLTYRAQGGKKAFTEHVTEIDSLRDKSINPQAAAVFGKLTDADIAASVKKVLSVPDSLIYHLVDQYGGTPAEKKTLAETLIARKKDLAAKYPSAAKSKVKPFNPEKISSPPSFLSWGETGKPGPSSKEYLNQANHDAVQEIYSAAKTGSIDSVKAIEANTYNKSDGSVTGKASVLEHPSQHVSGYAKQVINEIEYQLNPPKRFRFEGGHPLHALNDAYPSTKGAGQLGAVATVGKFIDLGKPGTINLASLGLKKNAYYTGDLSQSTYADVAKAAIKKMPVTQKNAIKSYTGNGYHEMNSSLWSGNPSGAAKAAGEAIKTLGHAIEPGVVLSRKLKVHGHGLEQLLKSHGKILQEPAIMSTSIRPTSWSGNVQLKMHVGPGVKGLWVGNGSLEHGGALSNHPSEDELILPPNTRLLILSVKSGGQDEDSFGSGVDHVIEAVILPTNG